MKVRIDQWLIFAVLTLALGLGACSKKSMTSASMESTSEGIRIMATYDSRFDTILKQYHLVSVTFNNQSPKLIGLDAVKDEWFLTTQNGDRIKAINNLRFKDPRTWNRLPTRAQEVIEYPRVILRNTTVTFDILVPKAVDLEGFQRIDFYCHSLDKQFSSGSTFAEIRD